MNKFYLFVFVVCLNFFTVKSQTINHKLNNGVNSVDLISFDYLKKNNFKNLRIGESKGYALMINSIFPYQNRIHLNVVVSKNRNKIQKIIDQVNLHADTPLQAKTLLSNQFPKAFFFRRPDNVNRPYKFWSKEYERLDGIFVKALSEELADRQQDKILNYANRFALEHPEQLTILHFNGRSRDPNWEGISRYSSGHWIYNPGCYLQNDITASDAMIPVSNTAVFKTGFGIRGGKKNDDIVIVPLSESGEKLWEEAEQVKLLSIHKGAIKVLRGQYETKARVFKSGATYIAPHAVGGPWGDIEHNNLMWYYNLSSICPVDKNDKQCADILAEDIGSWFAKDGLVFAFDGIQFDIASWKVHKKTGGNRYADIDTDGVFDKGFMKGENVFGIGIYNFYKVLSKTLGSNKLIFGDGGVDYGMRAVGVANGMEAEGLCDWGDAYKEYAKPLNIFSYWSRYSTNTELSYITNKIKKGTPKKKKDIERMVAATAQCLGVGFNTFINTTPEEGFRIGIIDELVKGQDNTTNWLGQPMGDMIDLSEQSNIKKPLDLTTVDIQSANCSHKIKDGKLHILSPENGSEKTMKLILKNVSIGNGDFHLKFSAKTTAPMTGFEGVVPRQIFVRTKALKQPQKTASSVMNYINSVDKLPCSFYFRDVLGPTGTLEIEVEGGGEVIIEDLTLVNAQLALAREFENGVVLVNPSLKPFTFNLNTLFKGSKYSRINGSSKRDRKINNGNKVGSTVTVSGLNGLFLIKD